MQTPKILIVDDEMVHLEAIIDVIEDEACNYQVFSAFNGKNAFDIAIKEMPDLIISDWEMPEMNGIELIMHLKSDTKTADIPVIMCTGIMISSDNLQTALLAGAVDYVRKPIDRIELIARINANLHLADKYNEIKQLNETKDKIFSVISHDLRGPVGTLKSFTDMLIGNMNDYTNVQLEKYIAMIGKQSGSVYSILDNLLSWANSQRRNVICQPLKQLVQHAVIDNVSLLETSASQKGITLQNHISENLTATFDNNLISTVVRNLINNAIKFTPKGGVVSIYAEEGHSFCTIIVSDTGIGISQERADKIFNKTYYETTYGTDNETGSGLGLKLCLDFVELNNGKIWVESEVGKGSKFCFTVPINA